MLARSWIAILLLTNYLLIVGMGCMNRPEDQHELILVRTSVEGHYDQQCRYLRMDGLEAFLAEALASRYQRASEIPKHHLISVVNGIDAHCLPNSGWPLISSIHHCPATPSVGYPCLIPCGINRAIYSPPRLGVRHW